jgi:hypothetical protein
VIVPFRFNAVVHLVCRGFEAVEAGLRTRRMDNRLLSVVWMFGALALDTVAFRLRSHTTISVTLSPTAQLALVLGLLVVWRALGTARRRGGRRRFKR